MTMREIAEHFDISVRTLQRRLRDSDRNHPRPAR